MIHLPESEHEFINALYKAAELGASRAIEKAGLKRQQISLPECERRWSAKRVKFLHDAGIIKFIQDGPGCIIWVDLAEIEAAMAVSHRPEYYELKAKEETITDRNTFLSTKQRKTK